APVDVDSKALDSAYGVRLSWTLQEDPVDGGELSHYRVYKETPYGSGHYGWIGDASSNSFNDFNLAGVTSDTPPHDFFEPEKPRATAFYQQRLVYGGDEGSPLALTATATGSFTDVTHRRPAGEADAFRLGISASRFDRVQHLETADTLVILSAGGVWRSTEGESEKFTPETTTVRKISAFGSDEVKPVHVGSSVVYSQAGTSKIRDLFAPSSPQGENTDLTILCPHLFVGKKIMQLSYSENPVPTVWAVVAHREPNDNFLTNPRELYAMTYDREQGVNAWSRVDFGESKTVAYKHYQSTVVGATRNDRYVLTMQREIRGVTVLPSPQGDRGVFSLKWSLRRAQYAWFEGQRDPTGDGSGGNVVETKTILEELEPDRNSTLDFSARMDGTPTNSRIGRLGSDGGFWWELFQDIMDQYTQLPTPSGGTLVDFVRPEGSFVGITREGIEVPLMKVEEESSGNHRLHFGEEDKVSYISEGTSTAGGGGNAFAFDKNSYVGMKFPARVELLPVAGAETPHRALKSVNRVTLWVKDTVTPLHVGQLFLNQHGTGPNTPDVPWDALTKSFITVVPGEELWEVKDRNVEDAYGGPHPMTGALEAEVIGQWDTNASVVVEHRGSRTCEILAVEYDVDA